MAAGNAVANEEGRAHPAAEFPKMSIQIDSALLSGKAADPWPGFFTNNRT
ncbi:hypothetical protein GCM10028786_08580 [Flaviaesturariibacter terrae]